VIYSTTILLGVSPPVLSILRLRLVLLLIILGSALCMPALPGYAAPNRLALSATPAVVDVGSNILFTLTAKAWNGPASVSLSFVSPHHGFTGTMQWEPDCTCFKLAVALAQRVHPLELARATATVKSGNSISKTSATFLIRGLAPGGKTFAPGGPPHLTAWVSDPTPLTKEYEHYCAWVTTADGLGVTGVKVRFVVRYPDGSTRSWSARATNSSGLSCLHKSIGTTPAGRAVQVDVFAGTLHTRVSFTPRT
jgi:hypothetical protein